MDRLEFDLGGVRQQCPRDKAGAVSEGMKSEQLVRRTVSCLAQTVKFVLGESHGPDSITDVQPDAPEKARPSRDPRSRE